MGKTGGGPGRGDNSSIDLGFAYYEKKGPGVRGFFFFLFWFFGKKKRGGAGVGGGPGRSPSIGRGKKKAFCKKDFLGPKGGGVWGGANWLFRGNPLIFKGAGQPMGGGP